MSGARIYYQDADCTLWLGDCRDVMLETDSADLLVTDPPYGQEWQSGRRDVRFDLIAGDASEAAAIDGLRDVLPSLRRGRHVYIFGRFDLSGLPLTKSMELVWDKEIQNSGDLALPWGNQHEYIQFAVYQISAANRADGAGRLAARLRKGSVLRHARPNAAAVTRHPTEKPVGLLRELIESSSCIGDTVLDPFAGSGSTLVAAKLEGRKSIGIEIEERYCAVAAKRLAQQVLPLEIE